MKHEKSKKQETVATSTMEAETVALAKTVQEALWFRKLQDDLGETEDEEPTVIYEDNRATILFSAELMKNERSKHIDTKYLMIKERQDRKEVKILYIPSEDNAADLFTKPLERTKFAAAMKLIGM